MICSNCGTENRAGAKFCIECGTAFGNTCPTCGTVNPAGAKFCSNDGTQLTSATAVARPAQPAGTPEPVAERRVVSILFADLVGFTPFAEERDAEEVRETLSRYFDMTREVIGRYGGTVEKFIGDAVMAVWGAPVAREDDAERAVRAALEVVDVVRSLGPTIQARAGVLTGEAAVTLGATNQGMVAGDLVNTAARLQSAAAPGAVLVGEATQRSAAGAIAFEPAGEQALKGKAAPVEAWRAIRVVAERRGRGRSETLEAPFVGRDEELRQLKDAIHSTQREGKARLVSVVGPGGIGKTRLSWEFLKYLDGLVDQVWWHAGRSPAYGDGITFWALGEMIRGRAGLAETDDEATTRARIAATVRQHIHDDTEAAWVETALLALLGLETGVASDQLFAAWRTFFERLAATLPVVMVFEDLHHADKGLLDFIDHLMDWSRTVPIMVITLARPELLERRPDWGVGVRSFASLTLEPLPPADMALLLEGLVPGLPGPTVNAIVERADGIPLYAVETVRMLLAQGRLVLEDGTYRPAGDLGEAAELAVPETLTALISARLDGLDPEDRGLVEDAAILGQSFSVAGLAAVSGRQPAELAERMGGLVRRELVVLDADPRSPERGQYAFVQALIREVAYNTLSKRDRKVRHLAAARFFESLDTAELAGGLAGHYLAAQRLAADAAEADALAAQARIALRGAAERAASLGSHEQALAFLEQALEVTMDPADRADLHDRARISAGQALRPDVGVRHAERAVAERRKTGDRNAIAAAMVEVGRVRRFQLSDPAAALSLFTAAWEEFSDLHDTAIGVAMMAGIAAAYRGLNEIDNALPWMERFQPLAERLGILDETVRGILARGSVLSTRGQPREGMILMRGAQQLADANDLRDIEQQARILLTFFEQWSEPATGLALGREGFEIAKRLGSRPYGFQMLGNSAINALRVGEWAWAGAILDEWLSTQTTAGFWAEAHADRALLRSLRGEDAAEDIAEAARLRETITDPQFESYELMARATAALAGGDLAGARKLAERAVELTDYFAPLTYSLAVRTALWEGDAVETARVISAMRAEGFWGPALEADRAAARAGLAALEGRGPEALAGYRDALRAYHDLGVAFDEAAAAVDAATLLPAPERDAPDIQAAVESARTVLTGLGARPFLDRLDGASTGSGQTHSPTKSPQREGEATPA